MKETIKLISGELYDLPFNADKTPSYVMVGTKEIENWTNPKPFVLPLTNEEDIMTSGADVDLLKGMKIGETRVDDTYEGIYYIRIA